MALIECDPDCAVQRSWKTHKKECNMQTQTTSRTLEQVTVAGDVSSLDGSAVGSQQRRPNQKESPELSRCAHCASSTAPYRCVRCKSAKYCSRNCQRLDWRAHSRFCSSVPCQVTFGVRLCVTSVSLCSAARSHCRRRGITVSLPV